MTILVSDVNAREGMMTAGERLKRLVIDILLIEDEEYLDANGPDEIATWDSLATVTLASAIEKAFGIPVPPDDMAAFNCIGDIKQFCRAQGLDV
jgi:acyl carrier protein